MLLLHLCFRSHAPLDWQDREKSFIGCSVNSVATANILHRHFRDLWVVVDGLTVKESSLSVALVWSGLFCSLLFPFHVI